MKPDEVPDKTFRLLKMSSHFYNSTRAVMRVSLGCNVNHVALPVPDVNFAPDQVAGAVKRVAAKMPEINKIKLRKLKRFTLRWCKRHLSPYIFKADEHFDFLEWLESTNYPLYRKIELTKVHGESLIKAPISKILAFIKDENYAEWKHMRGIYSRHDDYKVRVGPFFKKLGDIIFKLKWFIKKIPVNLRPKAMLDRFGDDPNLFCTDFSQYEATFVRQLMSVELILYRFILQNNPHSTEIIKLIVSGMMRNNYIQFYLWSMKINCKRMSGEMSTSVSNGFMNLIITHFLLTEAGNKEFDSYFEGDDSINSFDVRAPTSKEYEELGAKIKIEKPNNLCEASFCGQVFDKSDLDNVVNPLEALVSFGWTGRQYLFASKQTKLKLLKAKSLSLLYEYSGCPILRSLALYGLRMTNSISIPDMNFIMKKMRMDSYQRDAYVSMLDNYNEEQVFNNNVKQNTRFLVEKLYCISIKCQLEVEDYLDNLTDLVPLELPSLYGLMPKCWFDCFETYSVHVDNAKTYSDIPYLSVTTGYKYRFYKSPLIFVDLK